MNTFFPGYFSVSFHCFPCASVRSSGLSHRKEPEEFDRCFSGVVDRICEVAEGCCTCL